MLEIQKRKLVCGYYDMNESTQNYANINPDKEHIQKNMKILNKWIDIFKKIISFNNALKRLYFF